MRNAAGRADRPIGQHERSHAGCATCCLPAGPSGFLFAPAVAVGLARDSIARRSSGKFRPIGFVVVNVVAALVAGAALQCGRKSGARNLAAGFKWAAGATGRTPLAAGRRRDLVWQATAWAAPAQGQGGGPAAGLSSVHPPVRPRSNEPGGSLMGSRPNGFTPHAAAGGGVVLQRRREQRPTRRRDTRACPHAQLLTRALVIALRHCSVERRNESAAAVGLWLVGAISQGADCSARISRPTAGRRRASGGDTRGRAAAALRLDRPEWSRRRVIRARESRSCGAR
jgi:hypothetical protein